jgi:hypothetical protein
MFRLEFDQTQLPYYTEIDAVALLGRFLPKLQSCLSGYRILAESTDPIPDIGFQGERPSISNMVWLNFWI